MNNKVRKAIGSMSGVIAMSVLVTVPTLADTKDVTTTNDNSTANISVQTEWNNNIACDVTNYANIRNEGSLEGDIVGVLYRGCAAKIVDAGAEWTKIQSGDVTGYIRNDLFVSGDAAETLYESTFETEVTDLESLEHLALSMEQWQAKKEEEQAARAAEEAARAEEAAASVSDSDLGLLAAIIQCEAGGESYEGKIAVGAVIMNRINSGSFPNNITDVVYQSGQFSPVRNGSLSSVLGQGARSDCYEAARDVLNGANNIGGCLYFNSGSGKGIQIGNQHFY